MKWSRLIIVLAVIVLAAVVFLWAVLRIPEPKIAEKGVEGKVEAEPNKPSEAEKPGDANEAKKPGEPNKPSGPNEPMENVALTDAEMKHIVQKVAEWTGKVIIPVDDALNKKITIYAKKPLPRSEALLLIYSALREQGIVAEVKGNALILRPIKDAKLRSIPTVPADYELGRIKNKDEIVQKFFKLKNYSPTQLQKVIQPLMPEYGYVSAIESTSHLVVIDTVTNLQRIQRIIEQLDIPGTRETVIRTFEIKEGDPVEIVELLNILLGDGDAGGSRRSNRNPDRGGDRGRDRREGRESKEGGKKEGGPAPAVVIARSAVPIRLIAVSQRKWIIAKASAEDMVQIEKWIDKLDEKKPEEQEYTLQPIEHADVGEVARHINVILEQAPGRLKTNVMVQPLIQDRKIMIIGRAENREMVEQMIADIDIPSEKFDTNDFSLTYADPEEIKQNIEDLYSEFYTYERTSRYGDYKYKSSRSKGPGDPDMVKVYAFPTLRQVTVMCSKENMKTIAEQIKKWDRPIDVDEVTPLIIEVKNSDPIKMADLLTRLFTETTRQRSFRDIYFGRGGVTKTIVGRLYGQLSFEPVPDTRKIIVQSKIPEGYTVVKKLVFELDREEPAEVPAVVTLNYADPEDLSERLNAIFSAPGTVAPIRLRKGGLSKTGMEKTEGKAGEGNESSSEKTNVYTPPWSKGQRPVGEMPVSNVIGRIRFIPDPRSKAILVLAPPEFIDSIVQMIKDLDQSANQLRIKAIVVQIDHSDVTSLGVQLSSTPEAISTLGENAITALTKLTQLETLGQVTFDTSAEVTVLVDFLIREMNAKIINQQTLWTKDNEEADLFKGQTVPFLGSTSFSQEGGRDVQSVTFEEVGMTLRILPNITPQKNVDMNIDLTISQLTTQKVNNQPVRTSMNTTTTAIVQDGQTIMLGGILFQEDSVAERKLALLGDLPLVGGLFRHTGTVESNSELIIFITPEVIGDDNMLAETARAEERLEGMLEESGIEKPKGSG